MKDFRTASSQAEAMAAEDIFTLHSQSATSLKASESDCHSASCSSNFSSPTEFSSASSAAYCETSMCDLFNAFKSEPRSPLSSSLFSPTSSSSHSQQPKRNVIPPMTVSGNLLPPCRICLDKASGFHYGLNTCEACKGFFRRSLKRGASYVCTRDSKCDVTGDRRNLCGYCRYQKCIGLGMSKTAIKTGRYTHAKRTRDTLEIKMQKVDSSHREEELDFDDIIAKIIKAHDEYVISSTKMPFSFIQDKQKQRLEEIKLQQEMFGTILTVTQDEHKEIYDLTGIDIDNRREIMNFHLRNSERWIRGYISFAKNVPGFQNLTISDQANLIKYARIEFWFLGSFPGYSSELGVAVMPNGRCFTREEMYSVWKRRYIDIAFGLSDQLKKLKLTPEEMIMVKTICLTFGDRCKMEEPSKVEHMQWLLVRCLIHLLNTSHQMHENTMHTFAHIISCLTNLRDLNEAEYQTIQNTQLYEVFLKNPLIIEVLPY